LADSTWAAITGTGFLTKTGSATLKIDADSTAGSLAVNEGRYEAVHGQGFGAGQVAVASGAVAEMHDVVNNSTVSNHFTGAGTLNLDNDIIVLTGTSAIARINITQTSLVTALGGHSLGNADTQLLIDNSQILLGALESTLGKVTLANNSIIAFGKDTDFKRASISTLSGGGTLVFNTDLAREKTDHITIGAAPDGHYDIVVNNAGGAPEHSVSGVAYEIISAPMGAATYELDGGQVDVGMHVFRLHQKDEEGMLSVSLIGTEFLTRTGLYINNTAGAASLTWFSELDSLQKRLSELKYEPGAKNGISAWARGRVERYNYGAKATGEPFNETQWGANAGFDYVFRGKDSDIYLGAFMGYGHATRNAEIRWGGESESDSMQGGIYATIVNVNGWHVDGMLKYNRFDNDMTIHINSRETITASYTAAAIGGSIEVSKEFAFGSGWYVRPRFQGAMVVLLPTDYQTSGYQTGDSMHVKISRGSVTQGLLGVQLGRSFATKSGQFFQPYVNAFGAVQETAGGRLSADNEEFTPWIKGSRFGGGGGINWMPGKATLLYIDYEYSKSDYYDKPWGVNFGMRHSW
jgi:outer membrane autotransporter protein